MLSSPAISTSRENRPAPRESNAARRLVACVDPTADFDAYFEIERLIAPVLLTDGAASVVCTNADVVYACALVYWERLAAIKFGEGEPTTWRARLLFLLVGLAATHHDDNFCGTRAALYQTESRYPAGWYSRARFAAFEALNWKLSVSPEEYEAAAVRLSDPDERSGRASPFG